MSAFKFKRTKWTRDMPLLLLGFFIIFVVPAWQRHVASANLHVPGSYMLLTLLRPEQPDKFFQIQRSSYDLCAAALQQQHRPVKPFPVIPVDFVSARTTYANDGKRRAVTTVVFKLHAAGALADHACELNLISTWRRSVTENGIERSVEQQDDGSLHRHAERRVVAEAVPAIRLAPFTREKKFNGIFLKCDPLDSCIVDPNLISITQEGFPVQAAGRIEAVTSHGTVLVLAPVVLMLAKPLPATLFSLDHIEWSSY